MDTTEIIRSDEQRSDSSKNHKDKDKLQTGVVIQVRAISYLGNLWSVHLVHRKLSKISATKEKRNDAAMIFCLFGFGSSILSKKAPSGLEMVRKGVFQPVVAVRRVLE